MPAPMRTDAAEHMDRIYRTQRLIYDVTRRPYLLGRDKLLRDLRPPVHGRVLEIGCGTARNLIRAAELYPTAEFYGIDVSAVMLQTAGRSVGRHGFQKRITLAHADATSFDPIGTFGVDTFDRVFISYALSMIPAWREVLARAEALLTPAGSLHIADFGQCEGLPAVFRQTLFTWLRYFSVSPSKELAGELERSAARRDGRLTFERSYRGYAVNAILART